MFVGTILNSQPYWHH